MILESNLLYKYQSFSPYSVDSLVRKYFYFSSANELNDPFEFRYSDKLSDQELQDINNTYWASKEQKGESLTRVQTNEIRDILRSMNTSQGVLCVSGSINNPTMWSHYADSHKGWVLGFDRSELFEYGDNNWVPVEYEDDIPRLDYSILMSAGNNPVNQILRPIYTTKLRSWKYEDEYRMIRIAGTQKNKEVVKRQGFNVKAIREIIFGCKATSETKALVYKITQDWGCSYFEAVQSEERYEINKRKLTSGEINTWDKI